MTLTISAAGPSDSYDWLLGPVVPVFFLLGTVILAALFRQWKPARVLMVPVCAFLLFYSVYCFILSARLAGDADRIESLVHVHELRLDRGEQAFEGFPGVKGLALKLIPKGDLSGTLDLNELDASATGTRSEFLSARGKIAADELTITSLVTLWDASDAKEMVFHYTVNEKTRPFLAACRLEVRPNPHVIGYHRLGPVIFIPLGILFATWSILWIVRVFTHRGAGEAPSPGTTSPANP